VLGLLTLVVVVLWALRRESRVLTEQLADEVSAGVVGTRDYATIGSLRRRLALQASLLRSRGLPHVMTLRKLYRTEAELAFHKWQLAVRKRRPPAATRGDVLRTEVVRLRQVLGDLE
jgi:hypothetical protein